MNSPLRIGGAAVSVVVVLAIALPGGIGGRDSSDSDSEHDAEQVVGVVSADPIPARKSAEDVREYWTRKRMREAKPVPLPQLETPDGELPERLSEPEPPQGEPSLVPPAKPGDPPIAELRAGDLGESSSLDAPRKLVQPTGRPSEGKKLEVAREASSKPKPPREEEKDAGSPPSAGEPVPRVAPANDNFANAEVLTGSSDSATGSTEGATHETGEPNHADRYGEASIWYRWEAPSNGKAVIDTCGSDFDTVLAVYTGSAVGALTEVESNDDDASADCSPQSRVIFQSAAGTIYQIAVDGYYSATGNVMLNLALQEGPANDNFADAQVLSGPSASRNDTNIFSTKEPGEPNHGGKPGGSSIWYRWQAPSTEQYWLDTCDSNFDTLLGAYTGSAVDALTEVGGNDDDPYDICGVQSFVSFPANAGTTYRIAVDGFGGSAGDVGLNLMKPSLPFQRYEATSTTSHPNRTMGKLFLTIGGFDAVCSATAVNTEVRNVIFTAGHCVYDPPAPNGDGLRWISNAMFVPGYRNGSKPYGTFVAKEITALAQWVNDGNIHYDVAAISLGRNSGGKVLQDAVGASGIAFNEPRSQHFRSHGYPAAPPFDGERHHVCEADYGGDDPLDLSGPKDVAIGCDMTGGSSGGGWLIDKGSNHNYLNSVNSFGLSGLRDVMFGPYFGNAASALWQDVRIDREAIACEDATAKVKKAQGTVKKKKKAAKKAKRKLKKARGGRAKKRAKKKLKKAKKKLKKAKKKLKKAKAAKNELCGTGGPEPPEPPAGNHAPMFPSSPFANYLIEYNYSSGFLTSALVTMWLHPATDEDGDDLTYSWTASPSSSRVCSGTGRDSWPADCPHSGSAASAEWLIPASAGCLPSGHADVTVSDGRGGEDHARFETNGNC